MQKQALGPALFMGDCAEDGTCPEMQAAVVVKIIDECCANVVVFDGEGKTSVEAGACFVQAGGMGPPHYMRNPDKGEPEKGARRSHHKKD